MLPDSRDLLTAATAGLLLDTTSTVLNHTANPITRDLTVNTINCAATPMDPLAPPGARHQHAPPRTAGPGGRRHRSRQPPAPPEQHPEPKHPP